MHMGIEYISKEAFQVSEEVLGYLIKSTMKTGLSFLK